LTSADNVHLKHISEISRLYHSEGEYITFHFKLYYYRTHKKIIINFQFYQLHKISVKDLGTNPGRRVSVRYINAENGLSQPSLDSIATVV